MPQSKNVVVACRLIAAWTTMMLLLLGKLSQRGCQVEPSLTRSQDASFTNPSNCLAYESTKSSTGDPHAFDHCTAVYVSSVLVLLLQRESFKLERAVRSSFTSGSEHFAKIANLILVPVPYRHVIFEPLPHAEVVRNGKWDKAP